MRRKNKSVSLVVKDDAVMSINKQSIDASDVISESESNTLSLNNLTTILRRVGAVLLFAAAVAFLSQGWTAMGSLSRYGSFLVFTLVLAGLGIICGAFIKEEKGARTFMGIAAALFPVHCAQLGAMIYACMLGVAASVPVLFKFDPPTVLETTVVTIIGFVVLVPIVYAGIATMARQQAVFLTSAFILNSALLLIPTRNSTFISLLIVSSVIALLVLSTKYLTDKVCMQTWEGRMMQGMLFLPSAMIYVRNFLYSYDLMLSGIGFLGIGLGLFLCLGNKVPNEKLGTAIQTAGVPLVWIGLIAISEALFSTQSFLFLNLSNIRDQIQIPLYVLPFGLVLTAISFHARGNGHNYRKFATIIVIAFMMINLLQAPGLLNSLLCVLSMIAIIVGSFLIKENALFICGIIGLGISLLYHLSEVYAVASQYPWITLAILGVSIVFIATYIEKKGTLRECVKAMHI